MVKNYSVKIFLASIVLLNMSTNTYANIDKDGNGIVNENKNIYAIKDVDIKWLNDNTTFYVGSDVLINAYVNGVVNDEILWGVRELDGKSGVLNIEAIGSKARLIASSIGRAEVFAQTNDDTYSMRNIVVKVENYPEDSESQSIIASNIVPIQSRVIESDKRLVQVEANKNLLISQQKIDTIDQYLKNLAALGTITSESINSEHEKYEFYTVNISSLSNVKVELRVDKSDESYSSIKDKLVNINIYNEIYNDEGFEGNPEGNDSNEDVDNENSLENNTNGNNGQTNNNSGNSSSSNNSEDKYKVLESEITQGVENIIISGGYGDENNPIKIDINKNLSLEEQVAIMEKYITILMKNKSLLVSSIMETKSQLIYKLRVRERILGSIEGEEFKNDFFIEIIINKNDKEEYKTIISMLDGIYKSNNLEENEDNIKDEDSVANEENIEDKQNIELGGNKEASIWKNNSSKNESTKEDKEDKNRNKTSNEEIPPILISGAFTIFGIVLIRKGRLIHK